MTQTQKILNLMSDGQWHDMGELNAICYRYSARIWEINRQLKGKIITCQKVGPRTALHRYRMVDLTPPGEQGNLPL